MASKTPTEGARGPLIYRQSLWTRATHWTWAIALFFLLLSGLQIFNAYPVLNLGEESGFAYENAVLRIAARTGEQRPVGTTEVLGLELETTGVLGVSGPASSPRERAFPAWVTLPSGQSLASGRVVHFFFAWILTGTLTVWLVASAINGHLKRDLIPTVDDLKSLPGDIADHARLRFHHSGSYNVLQKLAYAGVLFFALPVMIATGLAMSPGANAALPWLTDIFGGRQTARTIHFVVMLALVAFFIVHMAMIAAAGPLNELRSIITGWYRTDPVARPGEGDAK